MIEQKVSKIILRRKAAGQKPAAQVVEDIDGRKVAAKEIIDAFHEKSEDKLMRALGNFQELHTNYKPVKE